MDTERQKRIERRAYAVWEEEGQPHGKNEAHWHLAARQIEAEENGHIPEKRPERPKEKRGSANAGRKRKK
jgi:Protein of unknown function (DUF2934)